MLLASPNLRWNQLSFLAQCAMGSPRVSSMQRMPLTVFSRITDISDQWTFITPYRSPEDESTTVWLFALCASGALIHATQPNKIIVIGPVASPNGERPLKSSKISSVAKNEIQRPNTAINRENMKSRKIGSFFLLNVVVPIVSPNSSRCSKWSNV